MANLADLLEDNVHTAKIAALASEGVVSGTECAQGFCPGEAIRRWVVAVWLVRVLDGADPDPVDSSRFEDVDPSQWWAPYVERLADLEVTVGCSTDPPLFCPNETVSREQMAAFLVRAFGLSEADPAGFEDTGRSFAAAQIDALHAAEVTVGCSGDPLLFCPDQHVTRAQMASFLIRARYTQSS